jgi:hypothetical protein
MPCSTWNSYFQFDFLSSSSIVDIPTFVHFVGAATFNAIVGAPTLSIRMRIARGYAQIIRTLLDALDRKIFSR